MLKRHLMFVLLGASLGVSAAVAPEPDTEHERIPVLDIRALMFAALDAPDGSAYGTLIGADADRMTSFFQASSPLLIDITTERRLQQPGCSRLRMQFTQEGVRIDPQAKPQRQVAVVGINYCRDGGPPREQP